MKDLHPVKGKYYIEDLIAQGEHERQDFKFMISDARKIARSISAFANREGGHLLIGVKDNGVAAGVRNEEDIYVVEQAAERYCRPAQKVEFTAFNVGNGITVIRAEIAHADGEPVMACDTDGVWKAFYRVADENIVAHPLMVGAWRRKAGRNEGEMVFSFTDTESRLLELLDTEPRQFGVREIALRLHITTSAAEQIIVRLAAIDIIAFKYIGNGEFAIIRAGEPD